MTEKKSPPSPAESSDSINRTLEQAKDLVERLDQRFQEISSVTGVINGLAKHSNLLALNAAIEAARAGEQGRGFAVVADEVRRLSEHTTNATTDIARQISVIQQESALAVQEMEQAELNSLMQAASMLAARDAARLEQRFLRIAVALGAIRNFIVGTKERGLTPRREDIDALMAASLEAAPDLIAFSCGCEPNAVDGRDGDYVNKPGHDATGRYVPYWNRGSGKIALEPLANYDVAGENDYYEIPRKTKQDILMEPYEYPVGGKPVLMTSIMLPLLVRGEFIGVVGADYALSQLQEDLSSRKPLGIGSLTLLSNLATYVTHPNAHRVGKCADDLPPAALEAIRNGQPYQCDDKGMARVLQPLSLGAGAAWSIMVEFDLRKALGHSVDKSTATARPQPLAQFAGAAARPALKPFVGGASKPDLSSIAASLNKMRA
ncbi:MAG TPA: methyl-accepting chemotaxis protein [Rhodocyclaceae bacterium]|nr:methyl-accepting chemotaxis protein [Rhodocyclaceae bacterium]